MGKLGGDGKRRICDTLGYMALKRLARIFGGVSCIML